MLKLKRTYDAMASGSPSPACSPHKITFLDNNNSEGSPFKRARTINYNPNQGFSSTSRESSFPTTNWNVDNVDEQKWIEWLPANNRRKLLHYVQNTLHKTQQEENKAAETNPFQPHLFAPLTQSTKPNPFNQPLNTNFDKPIGKTDRIFSIEDVKQIIQSAIEERESEIRKEYDRILDETLQEQFKKFSQFSQDYIDRQLKDSTYNYMI